jgi:hypothetical protein
MNIVSASEAAEYQRTIIRDVVTANRTAVITLDCTTRDHHFAILWRYQLAPFAPSLIGFSADQLVHFSFEKGPLPQQRIIYGDAEYFMQDKADVETGVHFRPSTVARVHIADRYLELSVVRWVLKDKT